MAHSFLTYKNRSDMMRDRDIFMLLGVLRAHVGPDQLGVRSLLDGWFFSYDEMPSGAINLNLDQALSDARVAEAFRKAVDDAMQTVLSFGDTVSAEWLTQVLDDGDGIIYQSLPSDDVLDKLKRFGAVIAPS